MTVVVVEIEQYQPTSCSETNFKEKNVGGSFSFMLV